MTGIDHELIKLREYQQEAKDAVWTSWFRGKQRPAVVLPTGSGKTIIFTHMIDHYLAAWPGFRVVILVHRDELADQAIHKLSMIAPDIPVGKIKAKDNELDARVLVCSVQTIGRERRLQQLLDSQAKFGKIGLVIVDECHHAAAKSYQTIMRSLGCFAEEFEADDDEYTRAVGFTATMARGDGVGLGSTWQEVCYSRSTPWMISRGYLVDVKGQNVDLDDLNLADVRQTGGDYQAGALGSAIVAADGPRVISRALREYAPERKSMIFAPDVASATAILRQLRDDGWTADIITGETPREDRRLIFKRTMTGDTQILVNCMVLTEGTDLPWMECAVIARPTRSEPLFIQMVGRVLRPWMNADGTQKGDALVLLLNGAGGSIRTIVDLAPGSVREIRPAETLADAIVREAEEDNTIEYHSDNLAFSLKHRDVDLFTTSTRLWLRTPGGVMFVPYRNGYVFLWPRRDSDTWDVCAAHPMKDKWIKLHEDLPLGTAQAWAETVVEDTTGGTVSFETARWRRDRAQPRQIGKARGMGIRITGTPTKGWVSDQINITTAAKIFDKYVRTA
jgi:superfamily II DNA or RNA helicase